MTEDESKEPNAESPATASDDAEGSAPSTPATPSSPATAAESSAKPESPEDESREEVTEEVDPLDMARTEAAQFREKMLRTAADFDNYRKRTRRELVEAEARGRDNLLRDILPVFDNLERAAEHAGTSTGDAEKDLKGLSDGIALVIRQFRDSLGRMGIQRVESVGQPFDPAVHEAIQHLETDEHAPGSVAAEAQPAYLHGERLVRPALVVVAKAPSAATPADNDASAADETTKGENDAEPAGDTDEENASTEDDKA